MKRDWLALLVGVAMLAFCLLIAYVQRSAYTADPPLTAVFTAIGLVWGVAGIWAFLKPRKGDSQ